MHDDGVRFLAGKHSLLEHPSEAWASLTEAWERRYHTSPDFSARAPAVVGIHGPSGNGSRSVFFQRAAGPEAIRNAIALIASKWGCERVREVRRPAHWLLPRLTAAAIEAWEAAYTPPPPHDPDAVVVWTTTDELPFRDTVLLEHAGNPGQFVHRARRSPRALWTQPATDPAEALSFPTPELARIWLATHPTPLTPNGANSEIVLSWKAAALARNDQREAERRPSG